MVLTECLVQDLVNPGYSVTLIGVPLPSTFFGLEMTPSIKYYSFHTDLLLRVHIVYSGLFTVKYTRLYLLYIGALVGRLILLSPGPKAGLMK